jgi:hypothetical protein
MTVYRLPNCQKTIHGKTNMNVWEKISVLDTSILATSNMGQREYLVSKFCMTYNFHDNPFRSLRGDPSHIYIYFLHLWYSMDVISSKYSFLKR